VERLAEKTNFYSRALEVFWLAVIFLVPLFFNPLSHQAYYLNKALLLQLLVFIMLALTVAGWIYNRSGLQRFSLKRVARYPLRLAIVLFGLLSGLSTIASITPSVSFWGSWNREAGLLTLLCWILFCLILVQNLRRRQQLYRIVYTLLLSSAIVALLGILQHYFPQAMQHFFHTAISSRVASTTGNTLSLSAFLAMVIPLNMAFIVRLWGNRQKATSKRMLVALLVLLVLQFWCLWLAQYSVTLLLFIVSTAVFIALLGVVKKNRNILSAGVIIILVLVITAASLVAPMLLTDDGAAELEGSDLSTILTQEELLSISLGSYRVEYWKSAIDIVMHTPEIAFYNDSLNPLRSLIGYGPETFIVTFQSVFPEDLKSIYTHYSEMVDRPHNHYLYLVTTSGILGLAAFIAILAVFFYLCWSYLRKAALEIDKLLLIAFMAAMLQYMADSFFNPSTLSAELVFWLLPALLLVTGRFILSGNNNSKEIQETPAPAKEIIPSSRIVRNIVAAGCVIILVACGVLLTYKPFLADIQLQKGLNLQAEMSSNAVYAYSRATEIQPQQAAYWGYLAGYRYIIAINTESETARTNILNGSIEDYERARQLEPYIAYHYYVLADVYVYLAQDGDEDKWQPAFSLYQQALQLFPENAVIMNKWALALILKGDYDEARLKLEQAASVDLDWVETSFLSALLLAVEGQADATAELTAPLAEEPVNLWDFRRFCSNLIIYDMVRPLDNVLEGYLPAAGEEWIIHAMLGVTDFYADGPAKSLEEFDAAMSLVPDKYSRVLFNTILELAGISRNFSTQLAAIAPKWREKLSHSPDSDTLLPELDKIINSAVGE